MMEPFGFPFSFTGEMMDANDLVYLRARYYHPGLGVFTSLDPVEGVNRYQYVGANPTNFVDPSGMYVAPSPRQWDACAYNGTDACCGPDVGAWFTEELRIHREWVASHFAAVYMEYIERLTKPHFPLFPPIPGIFEFATLYKDVLWDEFRPYGRAIPYKWMAFRSTSCPSNHPDCIQSITLCGKCIHRSELGNIMFGWAGKIAGIAKETLYAGGLAAHGLRGISERATAGLGFAMAEYVLGGNALNSETELCNFLNGTIGNSAGTFLPGTTMWDWEYASHDQDQNVASCALCEEQWQALHTVPSVSGKETGKSPYANVLGEENPFYVDQLPHYIGPPWVGETMELNLGYLSEELCGDIDRPGDFPATIDLCGFANRDFANNRPLLPN